jgi:hypothetical protein
MKKLASVATLSTDIGYALGKNVHLLQNGRYVKL